MKQFQCIACAASLLAVLPVMHAADLGGVIVRLDGYDGPASVSAQLVEPFKMQITVNPANETKPLVIRVELPNSGSRAWPAADVEVRDAQGKAIMVRRAGIEWSKLLIPVPAVAGSYFVQAVHPGGGKPSLPSEKERVLADATTSLRLGITKWHDGRKAALSIRFDDSHPTHLTKAMPILREYGFRGTFMINPGASEPGGRRRSGFEAHQAEWQAAARQGDHEFANHSAHHRGAVGDDDMEAEISEAAQAIWKLTPGRSKLMALNLGGGTRWETTRTLRYYLDKYHQFDASQNSTGMDDSYGNRVANFRRVLEQHLSRGLWCRIHYHCIGDGGASSEANFRAALDVAKEHQSKLWIAGMADIHKYQSERNASKLKLQQSNPKRLTFEFICQTDAALFDQPLTLEVTHPQSLDTSRLKVKDAQGNVIPLRAAPVEDASVSRFDVAPRTAVYSIEMTR
ncbi:MAG: polysaccharide deacetylase family protein [Verrucomicrobiia bacterium]|jgi:hypothetical protein